MKRYLPFLAASVLVLAACGGQDDGASDATIGAPDDGLRAPTPIEIAGGGDGGGRVAAGAAVAESADDMLIAPAPWVTEYVVGEGMPALPTDDVGYVFEAGASVTTEQVQQLAAALGVEGEPVRVDDGFSVSWRVGPEDGTAPSVWVYEDAQLSWNYNSAWATAVAEVETCVVSVDSDGNQTEECPEPVPPVGVPTAAEAEQRTRELLAALGVDATSLELEVHADEWFASASAMDSTDGRAPVRTWNVGFGAEGVLQYAGGALASPQPVGPYPLVDLDTAVARLRDGAFWYGGGIAIDGPAVEPAIAVAEPVEVVEPVETVEAVEEQPVDLREADVSGDAPASAESGTESVTVETIVVEPEPVGDQPLPVEPGQPLPETEPVVVTLVDVEADLWWTWDVDGSAWLLPAYRFIDTEGGWHVVPAVTDEFLIQVEPPVVAEPEPAPEPVPAETVPTETVPTETVPVESLPVEEIPVETIPPKDAPTESIPVIPTDDLLPFVGSSLEDFTAEMEALDLVVRVVVLDGEPQVVTLDLRPDRVNVAVEDGIVVAIESIG